MNENISIGHLSNELREWLKILNDVIWSTHRHFTQDDDLEAESVNQAMSICNELQSLYDRIVSLHVELNR